MCQKISLASYGTFKERFVHEHVEISAGLQLNWWKRGKVYRADARSPSTPTINLIARSPARCAPNTTVFSTVVPTRRPLEFSNAGGAILAHPCTPRNPESKLTRAMKKETDQRLTRVSVPNKNLISGAWQ